MLRLIVGRGQERGAVAVIVALVVGTLVLTGVAALTVDAGSLYAERRVVQNGADAASLELAQACARGDMGKCTELSPDLTALANLNSPDGFTDIDRVCGSTAPFTPCTPPPSPLRLVDCVSLPSSLPATAKWVEVRTTTHSTTANPSVVRKFFANLNDPSYDGKAVKACARAAWGPVGAYTTNAPITISLCMFDAMVKANTALAAEPSGAWPGYGPGHDNAWPTPSPEQIEYTTKYAGTCANSNGHAANGSFGWLTNTACKATVTSGQWINGDPGNNEQCNMQPYWGTKIMVPIFDCIVSSHSDPGAPPAPGALCAIPPSGGSNIWYHVAGWASFYLSGYRFPSDTKPSTLSGLALCGSPESCLGGWLTKATLSDAPIGDGGANYGVNSVQVAG
jgi:Putative Flp pilus-assembly TadE/G-like